MHYALYIYSMYIITRVWYAVINGVLTFKELKQEGSFYPEISFWHVMNGID